MRTVTIDRAFFNISSLASVMLYECDRYGNAITTLTTTIEPTPTTISLGSDTSSFRTQTDYILANYSLYMLESTENKSTKKILLFIFDGEGDITLSDIASPFYYQSIFTHLFYKGEDIPIVLEDFILKLDTWLSDTSLPLTPSNYQESIEAFMQYAERYTANPSYFKAPCLHDLDTALAQL